MTPFESVDNQVRALKDEIRNIKSELEDRNIRITVLQRNLSDERRTNTHQLEDRDSEIKMLKRKLSKAEDKLGQQECKLAKLEAEKHTLTEVIDILNKRDSSKDENLRVSSDLVQENGQDRRVSAQNDRLQVEIGNSERANVASSLKIENLRIPTSNIANGAQVSYFWGIKAFLSLYC